MLSAPLPYILRGGSGGACVSLRYGALAHIPTMSYTLPTLPYTALPCAVITANNLDTPRKFTVHVLAASCQYLP